MAYSFTSASSQSLAASSPISGPPLTMACWFNVPSSGVTRSIFSLGINGGTHRCNMQLLSSNVINFNTVGSSGTGGFTSAGPSSFNLNQWNHFCGVFPSLASRTAYLNGVAGTVNTENIVTQNTLTDIVIGSRWATTLGQYTQGILAECGIWNVALTAAEIASLAKGMTCDKVRPQSLVFYAPLVRNLQDVKGGLTITNNNSATVANHPRVYA